MGRRPTSPGHCHEPRITAGSTLLTALATLVLTLVTARLSWHFFEHPLIRFGHRSSYKFGFDEIYPERNLWGPFLLKVDVQGAELQVLVRPKSTIPEIEAVILEESLFRFWIVGPQSFDVTVRIKEHGFVAYRFCGFLYRPFDNALSQVDMIFARENGLLHQSHIFATPEQMEVRLREMQAQFAEMEKKFS